VKKIFFSFALVAHAQEKQKFSLARIENKKKSHYPKARIFTATRDETDYFCRRVTVTGILSLHDDILFFKLGSFRHQGLLLKPNARTHTHIHTCARAALSECSLLCG
jgi:hypothetical protein